MADKAIKKKKRKVKKTKTVKQKIKQKQSQRQTVIVRIGDTEYKKKRRKRSSAPPRALPTPSVYPTVVVNQPDYDGFNRFKTDMIQIMDMQNTRIRTNDEPNGLATAAPPQNIMNSIDTQTEMMIPRSIETQTEQRATPRSIDTQTEQRATPRSIDTQTEMRIPRSIDTQTEQRATPRSIDTQTDVRIPRSIDTQTDVMNRTINVETQTEVGARTRDIDMQTDIPSTETLQYTSDGPDMENTLRYLEYVASRPDIISRGRLPEARREYRETQRDIQDIERILSESDSGFSTTSLGDLFLQASQEPQQGLETPQPPQPTFTTPTFTQPTLTQPTSSDSSSGAEADPEAIANFFSRREERRRRREEGGARKKKKRSDAGKARGPRKSQS